MPSETVEKMNPDVKRLWVEALRSGEYKQTKGRLVKVDEETGERGYCCLGVLCELAVQQNIIPPSEDDTLGAVYYDDDSLVLPEKVREWAGLVAQNPTMGPDPEDDEEYARASELNDQHGFSFASIADRIEEYL